jgi:hypothetical protein
MPVKSAPDHAFVVEWALVEDPPAAAERVEEQLAWLPWTDLPTRKVDDRVGRRDRSRPQRPER